MPSRVIREGLLTSKTLKSVTREQELTYVHLLLVHDDFGRFDADPDVLASALYPTRREISPDQVIDELLPFTRGEDPSIRFYVAENGRPYLELCHHERHRSKAKRAARSKYPDPVRTIVDPRDPTGIRRDPRKPDDPQPGSGGRVAGSGGRSSGGGPESTGDPEPEPWENAVALRLEVLLAQHETSKVHKKPKTKTTLLAWAKQIKRLGVDEEEARETLEWLFSPENRESETPFVVQSGGAFREKYGRIRTQMGRQARAGVGTRSGYAGRVRRQIRGDRDGNGS